MRALIPLKALRVAVAIGFFAVAAYALAQSRDMSFVRGYLVVVVALLGAGVALGRLSSGPGDESPVPAVDGEDARARARRDQSIEAALAHIARLVDAQVADNASFTDRLDGAARRLSMHVVGGPIHDIVMALIEDNRDMQKKLGKMSDQLEESRSRIDCLQSSLARAEEVGLRDPVTSVGNRRFFDLALFDEIAKARASGDNLCLALADIDNFKRVNDRFGHLVGDKLLRLFADLVVQNVKGQDRISRYGGEEFAILFPNTRIEDAAIVADKIRRALETKQWLLGASGEPIGKVTVSIGVVSLETGDSPESLVGRVDGRLYEAKNGGRNRVVVDWRRPRAGPAEAAERRAAGLG